MPREDTKYARRSESFFFYFLFFFFFSSSQDRMIRDNPRERSCREEILGKNAISRKVCPQNEKDNDAKTKGRNTTTGCREREVEEETRPCSYAPVDSRNIFTRLTEPLSRRLLVRPSDVGARLLSDLLLVPAFAFFRGGARRPRLILPGRSFSYR